MKLKTITLAITVALGTAGMQAVAQDQSQNQSQTQGMGSAQQTKSADFSDKELKNFVELQDKISKVREDYVSKIESADSEKKARKLQQKAQSEMVDVIENQGMSVKEYNAIAVAYNSNPEVQERVDNLSDK